MMGRRGILKSLRIAAVSGGLALGLLVCWGSGDISTVSAAASDLAIVSDTFPKPTLRDEPTYTVGDSNQVCWSEVSHPILTAYQLEWSLSPDFAQPIGKATVGDEQLCFNVPSLPTDTIWYRIRAAFRSADQTDWTSEWSNSTFSIQDVAPPTTGCDITEQTDPNLWSTQDSITLNYDLSDPAGIDSVLLYRRVGDSGPWTMFDGSKPVGAPTDVIESVEFSSSLDLQGDNHYQFYIGGRDNAKAANWQSGDNTSFGNALRPDPSSSAMCEIKVDTRLPLSDIDTAAGFDSLYTTLDIDFPYWANDPNPIFHSGLHTLYLFWGVEVGTEVPTVPIENITFDSIPLPVTSGTPDVNGAYTFTAPNDSSIYYFYTVAVDVAGNRQIDTIIRKVRVFTTLEATLTLYDPVDTDDSEYTGSCQVDAVVGFNVPAVDSFVLCEDADFLVGCTVVRQQTPGPIETTWTFADCSDGEKWLYARVFVGGSSATAEWSIILHTRPPALARLWLYDLSTGDRDYTDERLVGVDFSDRVHLVPEYLRWLILSEDVDFATADTVNLDGTDDTVFTLSEEFERKTVYAYLVDQAENVSADTAAGSIMLFEHAHNYPNPFNPDYGPTSLVFTLAENATVTILVFDLFGNLVYESSVAASAGLNDGVVTWNGLNMQNQPVASGGYICLLKVGDREISRLKIAVIR